MPGDLCYIPGNSTYTILPAADSEGGFHCSNGFHWRPGLPADLAAGFTELSERRRVRVVDPLHMRELYREMHGYHRRPGLLQTKVVEAIFDRIALLALESLHAAVISRPEIWRQMLAHLDAHYREPIGREDLARRFGYTPQYVNALFKKHIGINVNAYVNYRRCIAARELLSSGQSSVKAVAYEVGYRDPNYFARIFRRQFGISPGQV
jgi:AraC-like DNA-binding protein